MTTPPQTPRRRPPKPEPPQLVSVEEAARLTSISRASLWRAIARGEIMRVKVGRRALVPRAEIDRLVKEAQSYGSRPSQETHDRGR